MLESVLDFQFEALTCYFNDGRQLPQRSRVSNGNAYVPAPYGIYKTRDGYLSLAMNDIPLLGKLLGCPALEVYTDSSLWFEKRDEIKEILGMHLHTREVDEWLSMLQPADIWCAKVLNYEQLMRETGYKMLNMELKVRTSNGLSVKTTRCPIRIDGQVVLSETGAPLLGEHNERIDAEFGLIG